MRKKVYIKESTIKTRLQNFLYSSSNVESNFYSILKELGAKDDKYILKDYNSDNSSFDCQGIEDSYKIRLGSEYAHGWNHSTIEISHKGISINYFYYLNDDLKPSLRVRDYSKEINGKIYTEVLNYSPHKKNVNEYVRVIKEDNKEVFFYIEDPNFNQDEFDKKLVSKDFEMDWYKIYNLLDNKDELEKYLIFYKEDGKVTDLTSYGFPIEDVFHYYEGDREEHNTKVRIKNR